MKKILLMLIVLVIMGCDTFNKTFGQSDLKKKCNETLCTDSLCLHWDVQLERCGTSSALINERLRKKIEEDSLLQMLKDGVVNQERIKQLRQIESDFKTIDSLSQNILRLINENRKRVDNICQKSRVD